mgnify:CR=1 FL=1
MPRKSKAAETTAESPQDWATRLVARCLGIIALKQSSKELPNDTERIGYLSGLGFEDRDIASMLGTTLNTVQVGLSKMRRGKQKKSRNRGKRSD